MDRKSLIAYFSRSGDNYVGGRIVDLPVGNTAVAATLVQEQAGGDLFRIAPVQAYPADYHETTEVAQQELARHARPAISGSVAGMAGYGTVYLGYPNWWGTIPMAVATFLEAYDFSGKTIVPFCTHEGSGLGQSERDIQALCPRARVAPGLAIRGSNAGKAGKAIAAWLKENG